MQTLTIKLPEEDQQRRVLLRLLRDTDYRLPGNTADATVTVRLTGDSDLWALYGGLWAMRYTCDAAPRELAELTTAVDAVLADLDAILDEDRLQVSR